MEGWLTEALQHNPHAAGGEGDALRLPVQHKLAPPLDRVAVPIHQLLPELQQIAPAARGYCLRASQAH